MSKSFTYHITLFVIKIKGLKKIFSKDPIDYKKLRKEDILYPKSSYLKKHAQAPFKILDTTITEVKTDQHCNKLLIFIHGGAFISGPAQHHWDTIKQIAKQTSLTIWMCDYPKAPENKIEAITKNIDAVYAIAIEKYKASNISFIGDSVGGTLITSLMQRVIKKGLELPNKILLISPVMDATLSNQEIKKIDPLDPMLSINGVLSAKKMCVGNIDLKNEMISPINGNFANFPKTIIFLAENDITYPDQKLLVQKLTESQISFDVIKGKGMPHIWPLLPVMKEAKIALNQIIRFLK